MHFYPPHGIYYPTSEFIDKFDDGWIPAEKPIHPLAYTRNDSDVSNAAHLLYDQYMASWDAEVARLFDFLKTSGLQDRSYIIITSDHGELFERGEIGHWTRLIYDAVTHVPLIIAAPGQTKRKDIHAFTSSVDVLPTIAKLTGHPIPAWAEGQLLPELGGEEDPARGVFTLDAKNNASFAPLSRMSVSLTRDHHRLTYYKYPETLEQFEFYDLAQDPEELNDLYPDEPVLAYQMQDELLQKLHEVNQPYEQ